MYFRTLFERCKRSENSSVSRTKGIKRVWEIARSDEKLRKAERIALKNDGVRKYVAKGKRFRLLIVPVSRIRLSRIRRNGRMEQRNVRDGISTFYEAGGKIAERGAQWTMIRNNS